MLNFELGHEEDIIIKLCTMDLREYLSATPSTSSIATIVTNNIESKEQCNVNCSIFLKFIPHANEYSAPLVRMPELGDVHKQVLSRLTSF